MEIKAVDLKEKRQSHGLTQSQLAELLGIYPQHVYKLEAGLRNLTLAIMVRCVDIFGSLKVMHNGKIYTLVHGDLSGPSHGSPIKPKDSIFAPSADLDLPDEISRLGKEARELLMQAKDIGRYVLAIKRNPKVAKPYLLQTAKEAIDLAAWLEEFKESLKAAMPDVYQEAEKIVREEFATELGTPALEVASA